MLFAVDFDRNEMLIEVVGYFGVGKRLLVHNETPVVIRVADREKNDLYFRFRFFERLVTPWEPVYQIEGVLLQLGRLL